MKCWTGSKLGVKDCFEWWSLASACCRISSGTKTSTCISWNIPHRWWSGHQPRVRDKPHVLIHHPNNMFKTNSKQATSGASANHKSRWMCCVSSGVCVAGNSSSRCEILELELPPRLSATQNQVTPTHLTHWGGTGSKLKRCFVGSAPAPLKTLFLAVAAVYCDCVFEDRSQWQSCLHSDRCTREC